MTPQQAFESVAAAFLAHWNGATAIAWDNVDFDPGALSEWIRFSWQPLTGDRASIGNPGDELFRREGLAFVQIFVRAGAGLSRARELEELALRFFEAFSGSVWFRNVGAVQVGAPDRSWYQVNVSAAFVYDQIRAA